MTWLLNRNNILVSMLLPDVDRILQKSRHLVESHILQVNRYQPTQPSAPQTTFSIEVTGFKPGSKENTMEMYFSNRWKSSGGEITSVLMEGDHCIVTFASEEGTCISLQ